MGRAYRWSIGVLAKIAAYWIRIFFDAQREEKTAKKVALTTSSFILFKSFDWGLMIVTASFVGFLKYFAISEIQIFLILWVGNVLISAGEIFLSNRMGVDFTLGEGYRRIVDEIFLKSLLFGIIVEMFVIAWVAFYEGAAKLMIFLNKRFSSFLTKSLLLAIASGFQMAIWTWIYCKGFDGLYSILVYLSR